jgi:hypothetical protein
MPAPPPPPPPPVGGYKDLPDAPLEGTSKLNPGVVGLSQFGPGVSGSSKGPIPGETGVPGDGVFGLGMNGVHGVSIYGVTGSSGVLGENSSGSGVSGTSDSGKGVSGTSSSGSGVMGTSTGFDAVVGQTSSDAHAGVTGRNTTPGANGGVGIYGVGGQYAGKFDGNVLVDNGGGVTITAGNLNVTRGGVTVTAGNLNVTNSGGQAITATSSSQDCITGEAASERPDAADTAPSLAQARRGDEWPELEFLVARLRRPCSARLVVT